ncbi:hypothetical protein Leryth_024014 [Lithospermum erythrorhizon]|nr:hypothetical protein Leryth_024014 [Lithospermum erythrorhizon]
MQSSSTRAKNIFSNQIIRYQRQILANKQRQSQSACDVFINHRSIDTKKNVSGLLYDHLSRLGLRAFLDSKNMKPGDRLFDHINVGIRKCKIGIAVFSPQYCDSYFCLHELAMLMECKKRVLPIFCDVKPSELMVRNSGNCSINDIQRFHRALEEAKHTVGLSFDTSTG